jgi:uncharacterized protein YbjT (DUF2867 family)
MRIVVLGANGQLGAPMLARLLRDYPEAQVVGCVREERLPEVKGNAAFKQHFIAFNPFTDNWARVGKMDVLINCVGIIRETEDLGFPKAHVGLTGLMLGHREQMGNPRIIQISALGADLNSPSNFLRTKGLADLKLLQHPDTVIIRPSIVCTPNTMLSRKLQLLKKLCCFTGGFLPFPERMLQTRLQPVSIEDLSELISRLCFRKDHPHLLEAGGKETYTLRQLLERVPTCRKILPFPQRLFDQLFPILSRLFPALLDKEQQLLLQQDNVADTAACERLLGRPMASTAAFWQGELA